MDRAAVDRRVTPFVENLGAIEIESNRSYSPYTGSAVAAPDSPAPNFRAPVKRDMIPSLELWQQQFHDRAAHFRGLLQRAPQVRCKAA